MIAIGAPLSVALVVDAGRLPEWVSVLVEQVRSSPRLDAWVLAEPVATANLRSGFRVYEAADRWIFRRAGESPVPAVSPQPLEGDGGPTGGYDVVVWLASGDSALAPAARDGTWVLSHLNDRRAGAPPLFWEMRRGSLYRTRLEAILADGERKLLYESWGRPNRTSLHRTREEAYAKARGAILRALEAAAARGGAYVRSQPRAPRPEREPPWGAPSGQTVARHVVGVVAGVVARRLRKTVLREEWYVAFRSAVTKPIIEEASPARGFTPIAKHAWEEHADPFLFRHGGATFVFFERLDTTKGRAAIAYGRLGAPRASPPRPALEADHHLSYPFLFHYGSNVFMIPESLESRSVDLYRAVDFPGRWRFERRLLADLRAVDSTLVEEDGRLWLFANIAEEGASVNDELHVYSSRDLAGPWFPHPANPVVSDVRRARPAGAIFRHEGRLIRPSQDCSTGYGSAVVFNSIDVLTTREYVETPFARLEPNWAPGLVGTHTYNRCDGIEVVDGRQFALRFPLDRVAARLHRSA